MKPALLQENHCSQTPHQSLLQVPLSLPSSSFKFRSQISSTSFLFKKSFNFLLCAIFFVVLLIPQTLAQNPCTLQSECGSGCCELLQVSDILGYYCQDIGECNKASKGITTITKEEGGSCGRTSDCSSNCCEGGVCRQHDYCYSSYLEPFIIILVLVLLIIIGVVLFFVIRSCIRNKKLKKKQQEKELQNQKGVRDQEQSLVRNQNDEAYQSPRLPYSNGAHNSETRGPRQI